MLNIALADIGSGISVVPSRSTYSLFQWLEEREREVYPLMDGYKPTMVRSSFLDIETPSRLPDVLRADQFAFVSLPLSEFLDDGVNDNNIGVGKLCPVPEGLSEDSMIQGVLFLTQRASQLAMWMSGSELAFMKADLGRRDLVMECGLSTRYLMARLTDAQRMEGEAFEASKAALKGLHFIGVQSSAEDDEVAGFWLLRETVF